MYPMTILKLSLIILLSLCIESNGYKILVLVAFPGPSHYVYMGPFIKELTERGHEVTAITNFKIKGNVTNYTEILIEPRFDLSKVVPKNKLFDKTEANDFEYVARLYSYGRTSTNHGLLTENVKRFIEREDLHFDLIFAEQYFQESWLMFAHKYKAPIVTISTLGYADYMEYGMGLQTPLSHVPHILLGYDDKMTFTQRFYNVILSIYDHIYRKFKYMPEMNQQIQEHFKSFEKYGPLPTAEELQKSISIIFSNTHRSLQPPRPKMPGEIDIGGAHIRPPNALPQDIKTFLDEAEHGAIYISFGAYLHSSDMPKEKIEAFIGTFRKLKQRVLWKWEDEKIPNLPTNVMVKNWMPQSDILAHRNIVLFVTHGGRGGSIEGMHRGVPMLFIPIYGDQHRNAVKAVSAGYSRLLEFSDITTESFLFNINEMITNEKYQKASKKMSALLTENPIDPMDEFVFWVEYVIRHKGAPHMRSAAADLSFFTYMLLDILLVVVLVVSVVVFIFYKLVTILFKRRKPSASVSTKAKKKKKN